MKQLIVIMAVLLSAIITDAMPSYINATIEPILDGSISDTILTDTGGTGPIFSGKVEVYSVIVTNLPGAPATTVQYYDTSGHIATSPNTYVFRVDMPTDRPTVQKIWNSPCVFNSGLFIQLPTGVQTQIWYRRR